MADESEICYCGDCYTKLIAYVQCNPIVAARIVSYVPEKMLQKVFDLRLAMDLIKRLLSQCFMFFSITGTTLSTHNLSDIYTHVTPPPINKELQKVLTPYDSASLKHPPSFTFVGCCIRGILTLENAILIIYSLTHHSLNLVIWIDLENSNLVHNQCSGYK